MMYDTPQPWQCQRCGATIGYLGRFLEFLLKVFGYTEHECSKTTEK